MKRVVDWITSKPTTAVTVVLGLVLAFLSISPISNLLFPANPRLEIVVMNEVNVFEINRPVPDLSVIFRGEDIRGTDSNLRIMTLRFQNIGRSDILQSYYDQDRDWGFEVSGGRIIDAKVVESDSDYLSNSVKPVVDSDSFIRMNKVIFESGKYFTLDVMVLHDRPSILSIHHPSKIANTGDVLIATKSEVDNSVLYMYKRGNLRDYLLLVAYGMLSIVIAVGIFFIIYLLYLLVRFFTTRRGRVTNAKDLVSENKITDTPEAKYILRQYVNSLPETFRELLTFLSSEGELKMSDQSATDAFRTSWKHVLTDMRKKGMITTNAQGAWQLDENTARAVQELKQAIRL